MPLSLADRTRGRRAALQMLYQWELGGRDPQEAARTYWSLDASAASEEPGPQSGTGLPPWKDFAEALMLGTVRSLPAVDPLIVEHAQHWRLPRMPVIDRAIIRLAVHELMEYPDTPPAVVIDEALELARRFSTEEAVAFINGVLDAIHLALVKDRRESG